MQQKTDSTKDLVEDLFKLSRYSLNFQPNFIASVKLPASAKILSATPENLFVLAPVANPTDTVLTPLLKVDVVAIKPNFVLSKTSLDRLIYLNTHIDERTKETICFFYTYSN